MKNGHITAEVYEEIRPVGSTRPRMYGVPKVHKVGTPLRPILSMTNAPQHQMARWLVRVLTPVVDKYSKHTIKDTFEFCDHIEKFAAQSDATDLFLCSFDITSLFTNVPLEETLKICLETLYRDADVPKPSIPENILEKLLFKATKDVEFSFDGVMYRQIDGIAMGSPLGPTLANIFVGHCESILAEKAQWPLLYDRFVDDTFSIFESEENAEKFFEVLNGMHPALKFTIEKEENQCLPFMDVFLQRSGNNFIRSIYRKPTFTGLYTRWDSFAPTQQKISLLKSLISRAQKICSKAVLGNELQNLKQIFAENGYPLYVIERTMKQSMERFEKEQEKQRENEPEQGKKDGSEKSVIDDEAEKQVFIQLPWIAQRSTTFGKEVRDVIQNGFPRARPRVIFTTKKAFSGRAKDVLPATSKSYVVYEFTCSCALTYVGKTTQCLQERIKQHLPKKLFESAPNLQKNPSDSAITRHIKESKECRQKLTSLLSSFQVIAQARNKYHLNILEALFIRAKSPDLCAQKGHVKALQL